jgi:hypothetical protein
MTEHNIYLKISTDSSLSTHMLLLQNKINAKIQDITWHMLSLGKQNDVFKQAGFIFESVESKILASLNELKSTITGLETEDQVSDKSLSLFNSPPTDKRKTFATPHKSARKSTRFSRKNTHKTEEITETDEEEEDDIVSANEGDSDSEEPTQNVK